MRDPRIESVNQNETLKMIDNQVYSVLVGLSLGASFSKCVY
jgi:hypothetical protein